MILPAKISPLKGLKTIIRNSTVSNQRKGNKPRGPVRTVYIHISSSMSNQPIRSFEEIVHADAKPNFLDNLHCLDEMKTQNDQTCLV